MLINRTQQFNFKIGTFIESRCHAKSFLNIIKCPNDHPGCWLLNFFSPKRQTTIERFEIDLFRVSFWMRNYVLFSFILMVVTRVRKLINVQTCARIRHSIIFNGFRDKHVVACVHVCATERDTKSHSKCHCLPVWASKRKRVNAMLHTHV